MCVCVCVRARTCVCVCVCVDVMCFVALCSPEQLAAVMAIGNSLSRRVYEATASAQGVGRPTYSCVRSVAL